MGGEGCESSQTFLRGQGREAFKLSTCCQGSELDILPQQRGSEPPTCRSSRHGRGGSSRLQPDCIASQYEAIWAESGQNLTRVQFLLDDFLLPVCSASLSWALQLPPAAHRLPSDASPLSPVTAKLTPAVLTSPTCIYRHVYTSAYILPPPSGAEVSSTSSPRLPHSSPGNSGQKPRSQSCCFSYHHQTAPHFQPNPVNSSSETFIRSSQFIHFLLTPQSPPTFRSSASLPWTIAGSSYLVSLLLILHLQSLLTEQLVKLFKMST